MTKEEYVKRLIQERGQTVKGFAAQIQIPYTTLLGMLKHGFGGASVDNVIRVCRGLGIQVEDLLRVEAAQAVPAPFYVSPAERALIIKYRNTPEMQRAVQILLGLAPAP